MTIFVSNSIAMALVALSASPNASLNLSSAGPDGRTVSSVGRGAPQSPNSFNPQIAVVTDFRALLSSNDGDDSKRAELKELELALAADVDPFLKAEVYLAVAKEDGESVVEVEEAFGRYTNLGRGLSGKFGKFAAAIGRVQRNHTDQLNSLDYPFVIQDFLGDEGLRAGGGSLSYLLPGDKFHEFTLEALDASETPLFADASTGALVWVGHYRTFFDFSGDA